MSASQHPQELAEWQALMGHAQRLARADLTQLVAEAGRFERFSAALPGMLLDLSKQRIDADARDALLALARASQLESARELLFAGAHVNATENRPALHTALRAPAARQPEIARAVVGPTLARLEQLVDAIRNGSHTGHTGRAIRDVVHIGIGGSHLGPELAVRALGPVSSGGPRCRFLANVDGAALAAALQDLNPETTAFIVVSKSFATLETRCNADSVRSWFLERVADRDALARHFFAITANTHAAAEFGLPPENLFPMWDWVGGRYSLWSAVGLPIALCAGFARFRDMLRGAHDLDRHFLEAPLERNGPVLMALAGVWNANFLGVGNHAVLPYSQRLQLLPNYLQQLEMESNGKSVHLDGSPVRIHTMPILWGGEGTNGQHAFHQLLHQGTRSFTADFIIDADPADELEMHQRWLLANALAQSQAMLCGQATDDPHRAVSGGKATTTLVLDRLDAYSLGALLALYEHKVFCQGVIWQINSFDQWGVELGKRLATPIFEQLNGTSTAQQDASTRGLVAYIRRRRGRRDR
ncbi:MAG: glucose-6-phosphate isomerase [Pseudomonadales bacterium]